MRKYTFVTVAHQVDYDLLCRQARSMAKYLPDDLVASIIVVNNGITGSILKLLDQYGRHRKLVRILPAAKLISAGTLRHKGWLTQQILKLRVHRFVQTDRYVCLDAKNIMINPLRREFLEDHRGRPRAFRANYSQHSSLRWLKNVIHYTGLSSWHITSFWPTITPFTMITSVVGELIRQIEHDGPFEKAFLDYKLTEFFLYGAFLEKTGRRNLYEFSQPQCPVIFNTTSYDKFVAGQVKKAERDRIPFFAVHRGARMSPSSKRLVDDLFRRQGIR